MKTLFEAVKSKALEYGFEVEMRGRSVGVKSTSMKVRKVNDRYVVFNGRSRDGFDSFDMAIGHLGSLLSQYALKRDLSEQTAKVVDSPTNTPKVAHSANGGELEGIEATLAERQAQYGDFKDVALVTQGMIELMRKCNYDKMPASHQMALSMIASKMARIVNGDFNYIENWHDISGYATLMERNLETTEGATNAKVTRTKIINGIMQEIY